MGLHQRSPLDFHLTQNYPNKVAKMPKGSGLTKPMKLSAELADIVGKKEASRAECIKQLWAYIKKNNLQDPENKQFFNPDKKMAKVFGNDRIRAFGMAKFIPSPFWLGVILKLRTQSREYNISEDFRYQSTSILPPLIFYGSISEHSSKIQKDPFHNYS